MPSPGACGCPQQILEPEGAPEDPNTVHKDIPETTAPAASPLPGTWPARTFVSWAGRGCGSPLLFLLWNSTTSTRSLLRHAAAQVPAGPAVAACSSSLSSAKKLRAPLLWPLTGDPGGGAGSAPAAGVSTSLFLLSFLLTFFGSAASSVSPVCSSTKKENEYFGFSYHTIAKSHECTCTRATVTSNTWTYVQKKDDSFSLRQGCICTITESKMCGIFSSGTTCVFDSY